MRLTGRLIGSRVARRLLALFAVSAVLPILAIGALSLGKLKATLGEGTLAELTRSGKSYGMEALDRLVWVEDLLDDAAKRADGDAHARPRIADRVGKELRGVMVVDGDARPLWRAGTDFDLPPLGEKERRRLAAGEPAMVLAGRDVPMVVLLRALPTAAGAPTLLAAQLRPEYLWGTAESLPVMTDVCVVSEIGIRLHCSRSMPDAAIGTLIAAQGDGAAAMTSWDSGGETYLASRWTLFLDAKYSAPSWVIVASEPQSYALRGLSSFRAAFVPAVVLSAFAVGLLALSQVRRTLIPLDRLLEGARRMARQDFAARVAVESGDEFGQLADAFNDMSHRLGLDFRTLNAFAEIDRAILTTIDLRAVAEIAVRCAREIGAVEVAGVALFQPDNADRLLSFTLDAHDPSAVTRDEHAVRSARAATAGTPAQLDWTALPDLPGDYRAALLARGQGTVFAVLPVVRGDRLWGWIVLGDRQPRALPKERLAKLIGLADRLAVALASAAREWQLHQQAHFDALTGLPNRFHFIDMLDRELAHARREKHRLGLLFLDLDRFKQTNDTLGHAAGDRLLCQAAKRIQGTLREVDRLGRLGGDEFTVLLSRLDSTEQAVDVARRLIDMLSAPFDVNGERVDGSASIGIAIFPDDADNVADLLKYADTAMYRAKAQGRGRFVFFEERMNVETRERAVLHRDLSAALDRGELVLHFQPQLDLARGTLCGVEGLVRWRHPTRGLLAPGAFLPFAEESGLIERIGNEVLRQACTQFRHWRDQGIDVGKVAVNVSPRQLQREDFFSCVEQQLRQANMAPACLEIEITESLFADMNSPGVAALRQLRAMGVSVALDDFGTGYSSFSYLKTLPVSVIKIDRAFIMNVARDPQAATIAEAIVSLSHALGKSVVAEGVEEPEQLAFLTSVGCESMQGFLISRPIPESDLTQFFRTFCGEALIREARTRNAVAGDSAPHEAGQRKRRETIPSAVS